MLVAGVSGGSATEVACVRRAQDAHPELKSVVMGDDALVATVSRQRPGEADATCTDTEDPAGGVTQGVRGGRLELAVLNGSSDVLANRCAGPRDADVAAALPPVGLGLGVLRHHGADRALTLSRAFSGGGFSGEVDSTLRLSLSPVQSASSLFEAGRGARLRLVTLHDVVQRLRVRGALAVGRSQEDRRVAGNQSR